MKKRKRHAVMNRLREQINDIALTITYDHVSAYAAQSAFFLVLSIIPILLLLLTLIQFTALTSEDLVEAMGAVIPSTIEPLIESIINQVYDQSLAMIPLTALVTLWSAGRGVMAISTGLNCIYDCVETRNYLFIRIRAMFYTFLFLIAIILALVMLVFGNSLAMLIETYFPILKRVVEYVIGIRLVTSLSSLFVFSLLVYHFLPNRKCKLRWQIFGAAFTSVGWAVVSFAVSIYLDVFTGFTTMYGSMTTIILLMLWFYFCMYVMLLGGEINVLIEDYHEKKSAAAEEEDWEE
jgi:membrane protein